ncbi:zonadhesin-like [Branchiostoma floridae]|uniref:Zonadhesin-like n=1 Tax=Branchiostoma floridae TaxID=7739 RepID=A0A9J7HJU0_BRAFL|nr:zonadhesin-like [Branchiostoma floridae]
MKPASEAPVAPVSNDVVNIGNECLGDVLCGDRVTCSARGDPHYRTFDGKRFNFQGNCKYVLSRGQDFIISARNANRRGNMRVSFVDAVEFSLQGHIITITQGKEVFVNGVKWTLPICLGFASITQQGNNIVIDTTLCITVTFDGNHHVTVQLPAHLAGLVGGLCGNANGIQGDDLVKPDQAPAENAVEFGNSWVAPDDMSCPAVLADQQFDITQADQAFVQELESQQFCGHLQDTNSPFSACFAAVEPSDYIDDCVYDMAASGSTADHTFMCENFEGYVQACAAAGIHLDGWREQAGCTLQCPPNSHYSYSTSACQDSCRTPTASSTCGLPNVEGCECDPGYIWSGMTCVEPKDCGCLHEGNYHALGEQWGTWDGQHCECQPNFQVICAPMSCQPGAEWGLQDGVWGCHQIPTLKPTTTTTQTPKPTTTPTPTTTTKPTTTLRPDDMPQTFDIEDSCIGPHTCPANVGMCTAFGDPHYQTFDGKGYFFQGACKYTLVRHQNFNVAAKNGHRMGDTRVSFVDAVELTLYGHTIWLLKDREVMIDGVRRTLPVCLNSQATIRLSGDMVMVETDMCVTVKYDGDHRVEVEVPPDYAGQVDGLCGNFNGNPDDELLRPDQTLALNEVDMGNSWLAPDDLACLPNQEQFDISTVDQAFMGELESTTNCGQITDVNGAFQPCIDYVNPANYFDACVYDMAAENGDHEMMCNAMEAYADACAAAGVVIVGWRDESLCGVDCPPNSHYSLVTACPATCANPLAPMRCSRTTLPGCACDEGYVLSGDRCVRAEECGCLQGNQYYALGEEWGVESTGQLCVCMSGGTIQCLAGIPSCGIEEQWSLQDGVLGCHPVNTPCDMKADVVFVVESSSSVPPTEFDKVRSFLKHVVEKVTIGADATQIAVVSYSSFPSLEFALHEHDNVFELKAGINNIRHIGLGTATGAALGIGLGTATGAALGFAGDVVLNGAHGACPGVPKIVVLITASPSEDDMALAAQTLHSRGVTVHAIGVGSGLSPAQLQQVASSPVYASTVIDFSGLGSLKEVLPETLCQNAADVINSWLTSTTSKPTTKPTTTSRPDDPPVADAGLDQTVQSTQTVVMLDGTGSHDDHGIISFFWQYPDQHLPVTLGDTSSPTLAVANLVPGEYTFTLTVTDASGQQDTDDVTIVVNKPTTPAPTTTKGTTTPTAALDHPPVAFAGVDEVVHLPQNTLTLDGSLSTDDHGIVSYQWEYVDHKLPVDMVGTLSPQLQLSNLHPGEYTFILTVTDTAGQQSSDDVLVIVQPEIMTVVNPLHPDQPLLDETFQAHAYGTCSAVGDPHLTVVNPLHPDQPLHDESFQAHAPGTCSAVGDPHYHTFDGKLYSFSGDCWYVLAKNRNPLEEQFAVLADNARCDIEGWEHEACTRAVKVQYRGSELLLTRDSISLNGQTIQAPISHNGNTVEKIENSYFHKVTLDNGLEILWDSHTRVYVKSPGTLQAKTAGLCGDFNGNPEDDFTTPSGSKVIMADTFAQSWKYGDCTP